jgi:hypothetical protein
VYVFPLLNAQGQPNNPTSAAPAGSFQILAGGSLTLSGEIQGAWGSFSASVGSSLTAMESNS